MQFNARWTRNPNWRLSGAMDGAIVVFAGHKAKDCKDVRGCKTCGNQHHTAICKRSQQPVTGAAISIPTGLSLSVLASSEANLSKTLFSKVFTKSATVMIQGADGWKRAMCYVDDGATISLVQSKAANTAKLPEAGKVTMAIEAIGV